MASGLYGIEHSNRINEQFWTKNCFNSSFPAALANYMLDRNIPAIYARLANVQGQLKVVCDEIPIREVYRCGNRQLDELFFSFETKFEPYQQYAFDDIDGIDLVIKDLNGNFLAPIEIKLTVLPTSATSVLPEEQWGSEIVIRTATTSYCAFSMYDSTKRYSRQIREIFEEDCANIGSWTNDFEMTHKTEILRADIDTFEKEFINAQKPILMQPFWKTKGQSPDLCDDAFDIVIWSDFAFSRLFLETRIGRTMSRPMRASARLARTLWELSKSGVIRVDDIYRQIAFGTQTDKELSVPGDRWRGYITSDRIVHPSIPKSAISEIINSEYMDNLYPERRFDQTLYFTMRNLEEQ